MERRRVQLSLRYALNACHSTSAPLITLRKQKRYFHVIKDTYRRSLALGRTNRDSLEIEKKLHLKRIEEAEQYIGLLRQEVALLDMQLSKKYQQITSARGFLDKEAITEHSLSDDEDGATHFPPPASDEPVRTSSEIGSSTSEDDYAAAAQYSDSDSDLASSDEMDPIKRWANNMQTENGIGRLGEDAVEDVKV